MTGDGSTRTDSRLVEQMRDGSREAFAQLYERHKNAIYGYSMRILDDRFVAEDVVQETFMKMQREAHTIRELDSFKSWLFRIARNEALMHLRKTRSNGTVGEEDVWERHTPLEQFISKETTEVVQHLLEELKHEYREVLVLREYEGMTYTEIAVVTGATESSVKSRIFKARRALTEKLKPYYQ